MLEYVNYFHIFVYGISLGQACLEARGLREQDSAIGVTVMGDGDRGWRQGTATGDGEGWQWWQQ